MFMLLQMCSHNSGPFFFSPFFIAAFVSMFSLSVFVAEHLSSLPFKCLPVNMTVHKHDTCPFVCRYMHIYICICIHTYLRSQTQNVVLSLLESTGIRIINLICTACIYVSRGSVWLCKCLLASCT